MSGNPVVHFEIIGRDTAGLRRYYGGAVRLGVRPRRRRPRLGARRVRLRRTARPPAASTAAIGGGAGHEPRVLFYVGVARRRGRPRRRRAAGRRPRDGPGGDAGDTRGRVVRRSRGPRRRRRRTGVGRHDEVPAPGLQQRTGPLGTPDLPAPTRLPGDGAARSARRSSGGPTSSWPSSRLGRAGRGRRARRPGPDQDREGARRRPGDHRRTVPRVEGAARRLLVVDCDDAGARRSRSRPAARTPAYWAVEVRPLMGGGGEEM